LLISYDIFFIQAQAFQNIHGSKDLHKNNEQCINK